MSLAVLPVFETSFDEPTIDALGEVVMAEIEVLDRIADERGLVPLMRFADNREVPEDFEGSPDDLNELLGDWNDWFEARDGAAAYEALAELIHGDATVAAQLEYPDDIKHELREFGHLLRAADRAGVRFRLEAM